MKKTTLIIFIWLLHYSFVVSAYEAAVVSAHPLASEVGMNILKKRGNAIDAAIATAFALGVVEPHHSGLGGGGFLLYYDAKTQKVYFLDYREASPLAKPDFMLKATRGSMQSRAKGPLRGRLNPALPVEGATRAPLIGLPGFVKGMDVMYKKWANLKWQALLTPSIDLAANGFPLKGLIREKIEKYQKELSHDPELKKVFVDPWLKKQKKIIQKDLAQTLQLISTQGADVFYSGELSRTLLDFFKKNGSTVSVQDLKNYKAYFRTPFSFDKGPYEIYSASLPSSGGLALKSLFDCQADTALNENQLIDCLKKYFEEREKKWGDTNQNILGHTTHLNVLDQEGNMVAMTNTLNSNFGAQIMVPHTGIILNDELDDFSTNPQSPNFYKPGVRPLSSMTPTIIFKDKKPFLLIGTPGGKSIPQNIFQVLFDYLELKKTLAQAIEKPKIYYVPGTETVMIEKRVSQKIKKLLKKEHDLVEEENVGNVQAIEIISLMKSQVHSDPRGEGRGFVGATRGPPLQ